MNDVVIVGGGHTGTAVAAACEGAGLSVLIVDDCAEKPETWNGDWVKGRGVVSASGLVAILDPVSGDEKRIVQAKAIVISVGLLDSRKPLSRMLGISKSGVTFTPDQKNIITDRHGRTRADGIYACGSCASSPNPEIVEDLVKILRSNFKKLDWDAFGT